MLIAEYVLHNCKTSTLKSACAALQPQQRCTLLIKTINMQETTKVSAILNSGEVDFRRFMLEDVIKEMDLEAESAIPLIKLLAETSSISKSKAIGALCGRWKQKTRKEQRDRRKSVIVEILCLLVEANAPVAEVCSFFPHTTPVHAAINLCKTTGNMEIVQLVVQKLGKASSVERCTLLDDNGKTPLHIAAELEFTSKEAKEAIVSLLLSELEIDPSVRDRDKKTAADYLAPTDDLHHLLPVIAKPNNFKGPETSHDTKSVVQAKSQSSEKVSALETVIQEGAQAVTESYADTKTEDLFNASSPLSPLPMNLDRQNSAEVKSNVSLGELQSQLKSLFRKPDEYFENKKPLVSNKEEPENAHHDHGGSQSAAEKERATNVSSETQRINEVSDIDTETVISGAETAAKEEDDIDLDFDGQLWKVECNEKVKSSLRGFSKKLRRVAISKLLQIASGEWNRKTAKSLSSKSEIYESRLTRAYRIIWGIAITFSPDSTRTVRESITQLQQKNVRCYREVIIVHEIITDHDKIHHTVEIVEKTYSKHQSCASSTSALQPLSVEGQLHSERMPCLFVNGKELNYNDCRLIQDVLKCESIDKDTKMAQQQSIVKYYSFTTSLVANLLKGKYDRSDDPFKVSDEEYDIINLPETSPVVLLGRSGTGKTTCCLCRMWTKFKNYWLKTTIDNPLLPSDCKDTQEHLHQVFIAKNSVLCNRMKRRFYDFVASQAATEQHLSFESLKLPKILNEVDEMAYPLFITAREFFKMLDSSLPGRSYFDMDREIVENLEYGAENKRILKLMDSDECDDEENDGSSNRKKTNMTEVTANYFRDKLWCKYFATICKDAKTDPLLVWMEIQSFIKGSAKALDSKEGVLSEHDYFELGKKMAPNFTGNRQEVYKIFEKYQSLRHRDATRTYFDDCAFILHLYGKIRSCNVQKHIPSIHQIYIDEVQDFTQAELRVLSRCCSSVNGLFLTGDTAQTIIQGVSFRFEDLRSQFHHISVGNVPELHTLTVNHRSMKGVIQLGTSVTDLLTEFFPKSFDSIPNETSVHDGHIPIFLSRCAPDDFALLLRGDVEETQPIDFGADQAVIVRTEESKQKLPESLADGLVLTIFESKGLEFNDVILYDFFSDSQLSQESWSAATFYLNKYPAKARRQQREGLHALTEFNESHHKSLSAELKQLYTAITRAKECIWIYESDSEKCLPMLDYWYRRELVKWKSLNTISADESVSKAIFPRGSSNSQWKERGDVFAANERWKLARICYNKAGNELLVKEATAHLSVGNEDYRNAAAAFLECDGQDHSTLYLSNAAQCLAKAKAFEEAATLFERLKDFPRAFKLYKRIRDTKGCIRMKEQSGEYCGAISYLLSVNRSKMALETANEYLLQNLIQLHEINIPRLTQVAREHISKSLKEGNIDGVKMAVKCIPDLQEQAEYLKSVKLFSEASDSLFAADQHKAAFRLLHGQGLAKKGYEQWALRMEDSHYGFVFTCQAAMIEIKEFGQIKDCAVSERLKEYSKSDNDYCKGKALIILCRSLCDSMNDQDVLTAIEYGEAALKVYEKLRSKVGIIESFNLLVKLQLKYKKNPLKFVERTLQCASEAQKVVDVLIHNKASAVLVKGQVRQFYDFKQQRDFSYTTAKGQDIWIGSLENDSLTEQQQDSDGFLILNESKLLGKIVVRFTKYESKWMENSKVSSTLTNKLAVFAFYKEVKNKNYLQRSFQRCTDDELKDFLSACRLAFQSNAIDPKIFDTETLMTNLHKLLKPFSLMYLPLRKHMATLRTMTMFKDSVKTVVHNTLNKESEEDTDIWLEAWQLHNILGEDITSMKAKLKRRSTKVNQKLKQNRYAVAPYEFVRVDNNYAHFFSNWLHSCELIKAGDKVLLAINFSANMFIEPIARRRSLHISAENIVAILSVHTTAVLAMISCCLQSQGSSKTLVVPETFIVMVQNFDALNCQSKTDVQLFKACLNTAQHMNPGRLLSGAYSVLRKLFNIVIGEYKSGFNVLKYATRGSIESGEATHCLILVAVIFGNLALAGCPPQLMERHQQLIAQALQSLFYSKHKNTVDPRIIRLQQAYAAFVYSTNTKDLFRSVVGKLLNSVGMSDLFELKLVRSLSVVTLKHKPILQHQVPEATLPICKYEQILPSYVSHALKECIKTDTPTSRAVQIKKPPSQAGIKEIKKIPTIGEKDIAEKYSDISAGMSAGGANIASLVPGADTQLPELSASQGGVTDGPKTSDIGPEQNNTVTMETYDGSAKVSVSDPKKVSLAQVVDNQPDDSETENGAMVAESKVTSESLIDRNSQAGDELLPNEKEGNSIEQFERLESFPESEQELQEEDLEVYIDDEDVLQEAINAVTQEEGDEDSSSDDSDFEDIVNDQTVVDSDYCKACSEQFESEDEHRAHVNSIEHKFRSEVYQTYDPVEMELQDILDNEEHHSQQTAELLDEARQLIERNKTKIDSLAMSPEWEASLAEVRDMQEQVFGMLKTIKEQILDELDAVEKKKIPEKLESVDETGNDEMSDDDDDFKLEQRQTLDVKTKKKKGTRNERRKKTKQKVRSKEPGRKR